MKTNLVKCPKCQDMVEGYFCPKCGAFTAGDEYDKNSYCGYELVLARILSNLRSHPHINITVDEEADLWARKVEKLRSLLHSGAFGSSQSAKEERLEKVGDFLERCRSQDFQVAFVGAIKTGKSTLINALLGRNYASMDVTPETAALTKFRASRRDYIQITFYSLEEWRELELAFPRDERTGKLDENEQFIKEYKRLNAEAVKNTWVGHETVREELENSKIEERLSKWTSSKHPEHYFVKEVEIGISTLPPDFPEKIVFVDTPGLLDPVAYRSKITQDYIRKASAIFVCIGKDRLTEAELRVLQTVFQLVPRSGRDNEIDRSIVRVIVTHTDEWPDPRAYWEKQRSHYADILEGPGFFKSRELAMRNILPVSAYLHNLCRDYAKMSRDEWGIATAFLMSHCIRLHMMNLLSPTTYTSGFSAEELLALQKTAGVRAVEDVLYGVIKTTYRDRLKKELSTLYSDVKHLFVVSAEERSKDIFENLQATDKDIKELERLIAEKRHVVQEVKASRDALLKLVAAVELRTDEALEIIQKKLVANADEGIGAKIKATFRKAKARFNQEVK